MAKPTAAQVRAQLEKTKAANAGNQPDAATLQKRAVRQAERGELTTSQQQQQNAAFAKKTAKADAERRQAQGYTQPATTGTASGGGSAFNYGRAIERDSQGMKIQNEEWSQGWQDQFSYDTQQYQQEFHGGANEKIDKAEWVQGVTDQFNFDILKAKKESLGHAGQDSKVTRQEFIENPVESPIKAKASMGGVKPKDVFSQQNQTAQESGAVFNQNATNSAAPVFLNPERVNPSANLTGKIEQTKYVPPSEMAPKMPYGALDVDENGQAFYGTGVKGWIRKTWADLTDPTKYKYDYYELTPAEQKQVDANYQANIANSAAILNERLKWDTWGKNLFGLSAEEVAAFTSSRGLEHEIAQDLGKSTLGADVSRVVRIGVDTTQNFIWGGLDLLGLDDTAVRKAMSYRAGVDAVADKYNKDEDTNFFSKSLNSGNWLTLAASGPIGAVYNAFEFGKDLITVAANGQLSEVNPLNAESTARQYMAGSSMAYSMVYDEIARAEFEKGVAEGKDPALLAQNYGNLGIELAGSIIGSPSTYLGASIVKPAKFAKWGVADDVARDVIFGVRVPWKTVAKIPTFGEILGLGLGHARMVNAAARFEGVADQWKPVVTLLEDASKADNVAGKLDEVVQSTAKVFDDNRLRKGSRWWNIAAYDSNGKISVASRDADLFIGSLIGNEGVGGALEIMSDMVMARKGGDEAIKATERLLTRTNSGVFSEVGDMVGEVLSRLDDMDLLSITKKYAGSPETSGLHAELMGKVSDVLEEFIPSVDEMVAAKKLVNKGVKVDERTLQLAKFADELPTPVKVIRGITKVPQAIATKTSGYMVQSFMALMPRSTAKNVWGQIVPIAFQTGMANALQITAETLTGGLNQQVLEKIAGAGDNVITRTAKALTYESFVARKVETIQNLIDFMPTQQAGISKVTKGDFLGDMLKKVTGGFMEGQLPKMGRMETIASLGIIETTLKNELQKALPAVTKNLPEYEAFMKTLPKEQRGLFGVLLENNYGNWDNAMNELRSITATGEIEAWRITQIPPTMRKELDRMGMLDTFYDIQKKVETPEQLDEFIKKFEDTYRAGVMDEAKKLPSTMQTPPKGEEEFFTMLELRPGRQNDTIRELYVSAQNMRDKLDEVTANAQQSVLARMENITDPMEQQKARQALSNFIGQTSAIQKEVSSPTERNNAILEQTKKWYFDVYQKQGGTFTEAQKMQIWNKEVKLGFSEGYSLSKIYPNMNPSQIPDDEFVDLMWKAQRNDRASKWWFYNNKKYTNTMNALEQMASELGTTLDDIATMDKGGDNPYRVLQQLNGKYQAAEEMYGLQRYLDQFTALPDTKLSALAGDAHGMQISEEYITRIVNTAYAPKTAPRKANPLDYLKNHGGIAPKDFKDIFGESNAAGILPGLMKKDARAIDDVGIRLWEGGFITREQADDYEYIRDLLRGFEKGVDMTDAQIAVKQLDDMGGFIPYSEVTLAQAREALQQLKFVPSYDGGQINEARVAYEGLDNFVTDVKLWGEKVKGEWGKTVKSTFVENEEAMRTAQKAYEERMKIIKRRAAVTAVSTRNFALHDYNKTYLDHALTMVLGNSLHYWSTRSYMRSLEMMLDQPRIANVYMAYKEYMTRQHSDMPEWYRYNIDVGALMGLDTKNQYFINLEAAINPMNGLTGVDFDDPYKRVDWMSRTVADVGKMGVGVSPFIQWALALKLNEQGKAEAAQRWAGRLLPFSQTVKSVSGNLDNMLNKFGMNVDTQAVEIDPFVLAFGEGKTLKERMLNSVDPYEKNKVVAALAMMVDAGQITEEQMIEAARARSGDIWQQGIEAAADKRASGDVQSFFLGSAMKPRTEDDMKIEKFWGDYNALQSSRSQMTPDQYREAWLQMKENPEYGQFMEGLLLSRKSGDAMDMAYTYNVLGRVPPGQMNDFAKLVGLDPEDIALFYDSKGDFSQMGLSGTDLTDFQNAISDLAAMLTLPDAATRRDWGQATSLYSAMNTELEAQFGMDINDKISAYYDAPNAASKEKYLEDNPDVRAAMQMKDEYIANTPVLMQYYGGLDTLERYYNNQTYKELESKYSDVIPLVDELYDPNTSQERKDQIRRESSKLVAYQQDYAAIGDTVTAQLTQKYGDISAAIDEYYYPTTSKERKAELDRQYHVKAYKKEEGKLRKEELARINEIYGEEIVMDAREYGNSAISDERKREIEEKYSDIEKYMNEKADLQEQNLQDILEFGDYLPDPPMPELIGDPATGDEEQQAVYDYVTNGQMERTFEDWQAELGNPLTELIRDYADGGDLDYYTKNRLEYLAGEYGYRHGNDLLQAILMSIK